MNIAPVSLLFAALFVAGGPAFAQDTDGWAITEASGALIASASYESGQSFVIRCLDGKLDVMMTGMPIETGLQFRKLEWASEGGEHQRQTWINLPDRPMVFAARPVHVARILRKGGAASVRLLPTAEMAQTRRYDLPLPSDGSGVDHVLTACEVRLDDPRDDLIEIDPPIEKPGVFPDIWQKQAFPAYPNSAMSAGAGDVMFSCIVADSGRLSECRVERETPPRVGFGPATLTSLLSARLRLGPGVEPGRLIIGRQLYRLD